ncbi:MAG TPA: ECF-type sigma factor [Candidatus Acidoferrum sp.]|nr:ECF-type sigma factor [Candidatus Acidoferrum sp.]
MRIFLTSLGEGGALSNPPVIGDLLARWSEGDQEAFRALVPLLYDDLRLLAHRHLRKARTDRTLQTTALVHELYLHLERYPQLPFQNRAHFVAVCAMVMRQILSRYERDRRAAKRGGGEDNLTLDDAGVLMRGRSIDFIALDDALDGLARLDLQQSRIVELRFFGGLSIDETAEVLTLSPATVKRHWETARVWLRREMSRDGAK